MGRGVCPSHFPHTHGFCYSRGIAPDPLGEGSVLCSHLYKHTLLHVTRINFALNFLSSAVPPKWHLSLA